MEWRSDKMNSPLDNVLYSVRNAAYFENDSHPNVRNLDVHGVI